MFVDKLGFEHTGREGFLSRMRLAWDQFELEVQERDAEWDRYIQDHGLDCFEHRRNDPRLIELVGKGIPDKHRKAVWLMLLGYTGRSMPGYYADLLARSSPDSKYSQDIAQDLERTFPNHPILQQPEGRDQLRRVLTAFSVRNPNIGYCQSMNFVCFFLLLVLHEEEKAFWGLVVLVEELFPDYYSKHMIGSQVDLRCFNDLLEQNLPALYARDKILMAKSLGDLMKVFSSEALLLDPLPLLLCAHAFAHLRPQVQASRMRYWTRITQEIDDLHERRDIRVLRERTGIDGAKLKDLRAEFKALSMDGSGITFLQFQQVLSRVLPHWVSSNHTPLERIFEVFDEDADKILSFQELMSGLSILYQGSFDEKLTLIFKSFAVEKKDLLTREEALAMCDHVFKTFYRPSPFTSPSTSPTLPPSTSPEPDILDQLYSIVEKEFSDPRHVDGLSLDGLRQIVFTNAIVLQCFQPFGASMMGSMYSPGVPSLSPRGGNALHILDPPPSSAIPPPLSMSPPRSQMSFANFAAFLQKSPQMSSPSSPITTSLSSHSIPSPSRTRIKRRLTPPLVLSPFTVTLPTHIPSSSSSSTSTSTARPGSPPRSCVPSSSAVSLAPTPTATGGNGGGGGSGSGDNSYAACTIL